MFFVGSEIKVIEDINLEYEYPEGGRFKRICFAGDYIELTKPIPLGYESLSLDSMPPKIKRCISFYSHSIKDKNIITSISLLLSALDLASGEFDLEPTVKHCVNCNHKTTLNTGIATKFEFAMVEISGYSRGEFKKIWKLRNSIFHGFFEITAENVRELYEQRKTISITFIKTIKHLLQLKENELPLETGTLLNPDAAITVEYFIPE